MSVGQWPADTVAASMLRRLGHDPSQFDPLLLAALAQLVLQVIKMAYECRNKPTAMDVRAICRKPSGVQWAMVTHKVRQELGSSQYRKLGGRRLVDAGFQSVLDCSDADLCSMLLL